MKTTNKSLHSQYNILARKLANEKRAREYDMFRRKLAAFTGCEIKPEHSFFPGRKWRIDFAIVDLKIGIEIEGGVWTNGRHTRGKGFIEDIKKYNAAATLGWVILRFTPQDLNKITTFETVQKTIEARRFCLDREKLDFILNKALNAAICRKSRVIVNSNAISEWVTEFIKSC